MKKLKYKWLALLITSLSIIMGFRPSSTFLNKVMPVSTEVSSVKEAVLTKEVDTQNTVDMSGFTGKNFSVLPKNERLLVTLKKHTDGDTSQFILSGHKISVRYLLIDTPETRHPNKEVQPFGNEASNRTKELLENANTIEIMLDNGDRTDHYKRVLAYVFVDGVLVQDTLIKEGLGRVAYITEPSTTYLDQLLASQQLAEQKKVGIWSLDNYVTDKGFNP